MPEPPTDLGDVIVTGFPGGSGGGAGGGGGAHDLPSDHDTIGEGGELPEFPPECSLESTRQNRVDSSFISNLEGGDHSQGYWPGGNSGVTIASGVDLGSQSESSLRDLGLDESTIDVLEPYLGRKGQSANSYLQNHPLTISDQQKYAINYAINLKAHRSLSSAYRRDSGFDFYRLPSAAQTVIYSVGWQYGAAGLAQSTPNFWNAVTERRWSDAANELSNFGDDYPTRRQTEAALLRQAIANGALPSECQS